MGSSRFEHQTKMGTDLQVPASTGVVGLVDGYQVYGESKMRAVLTGVGGTCGIDIEGKIRGQDTWVVLDSFVGPGSISDTDIGTWDFVRFNITTADGTGKLVVSAFFSGGGTAGSGTSNSFETIVTDLGTSPVATSSADILTFTSVDGTLDITGNSTTDTIDLSATGLAGSNVTSVNSLLGAVVLDPDDLDDALTTNKFVTQAQLDLIEDISMFASFKVNEVDEAGSLTYLGKCKPGVAADWLIERFDDTTDPDLVVKYANISNNGGQATFAAAWTNRATLTYEDIQDLTI